LLFFKLKFSIR